MNTCLSLAGFVEGVCPCVFVGLRSEERDLREERWFDERQRVTQSRRSLGKKRDVLFRVVGKALKRREMMVSKRCRDTGTEQRVCGDGEEVDF